MWYNSVGFDPLGSTSLRRFAAAAGKPAFASLSLKAISCCARMGEAAKLPVVAKLRTA
jgi:hypothetical protein